MQCFKSKVTLKCKNYHVHITVFQSWKYILKVMLNEFSSVNCRQTLESLFI